METIINIAYELDQCYYVNNLIYILFAWDQKAPDSF